MDLSEILVGVVERVMLLECQAPRLWRGIFDFSLTSNFYQDEESQNGSPKGRVEKVPSVIKSARRGCRRDPAVVAGWLSSLERVGKPLGLASQAVKAWLRDSIKMRNVKTVHLKVNTPILRKL